MNPRTKPNENHPKPMGNAQPKENTHLGHKYENNPLLRKPRNSPIDTTSKDGGEKAPKDSQPNRPVFSPISEMKVVIDITNPTSMQIISPLQKGNTKSNPNPSPHLKKPPDIVTYHEFARVAECHRELPQGEHVDRTRRRSHSPSKSCLVAEELKFKIKLCERFLGETARHMATLKPLVHQDQAKGRIRSLLGLPDSTTLEDHLVMECFNILIWNCRGAGNDNFKRNFRDIINQHKPEMVALLETKVDLKSMGMFFKDLGLTAATHVDPNGRAGGIWILWDPSKVSLNTTHKTSQVIHTTVQKDTFEDWIFSAVYGSPNPRICEILWEELSRQAGSNQQPWLLAREL